MTPGNPADLSELYSKATISNRYKISSSKRTSYLAKKQLRSSDERIVYFRNSLEKKRVSFLDDSIVLVIDRNNLINDTISQIETTDGFDFHKEIKIFFIDEEAQDAGAILKEWIFMLIQTIFTSQ